MKVAHDINEFDAVWVMDDDGLPDKDCLKNLCDYLSEHEYIAPMVLNIDNHIELAFPYPKEKTLAEIKLKYPDGIILNYSNPFNGILYRMDLIDKIGYPKKDMFIWGDEVEYADRCSHYGFNPITIINAIHYHPKDRLQLSKDIRGRYCIIDVDSDLRNYCKARNTIYSMKKYGAKTSSIVIWYLNYILYYLFVKKSFHGLYVYNKAFFAGLFNKFNGHKKYLK
jgi:rhamnopyranosyl-N-acetylglucosaminyl-diphospho-decaprenol beta-1,3/1,4-galactofuranosyltransferase